MKGIDREFSMGSVKLVIIYCSIVSTAVGITWGASNLQSDGFLAGTGVVNTVGKPGDGLEISDAERLCRIDVSSKQPARSVVEVDSRSSQQLADANFQVIVKVRSPLDHYEAINNMVCRVNVASGKVSSNSLENHEDAQEHGAWLFSG